MDRRNFFTTVGALVASLTLPSVDERALRFKNYARIYDGDVGGVAIGPEEVLYYYDNQWISEETLFKVISS